MKTALDLVQDHLDSIVFVIHGMPVSEAQRYLLKRATDAQTHWVQTCALEAEREGKSDR